MNVTVSSIFLRLDICSNQTMGIGKRMMVRSMNRLQMLKARRKSRRFPHVPDREGCQNLAVGMQMRTEATTTPTPKAITRTTTACATLRNVLFERNTVM